MDPNRFIEVYDKQKHPKGATHISHLKSQFGKPYRISKNWFLFGDKDDESIYFWCEYQRQWVQSKMSKEILELSKLVHFNP